VDKCFSAEIDIVDAFQYIEFQPSTCLPNDDMYTSFQLQECSQTNDMNSQDFVVKEFSNTNCEADDFIMQDSLHFPDTCIALPPLPMGQKVIAVQMQCQPDGQTRVSACDQANAEDIQSFMDSYSSVADAKSKGLGVTSYVKPDSCITIDATKFGITDLKFNGVFSGCESGDASLSIYDSPDCSQDFFAFDVPLDVSGECGNNNADDVSFAVTCPPSGLTGADSFLTVEVCEATSKQLVLESSRSFMPQPEVLMDYLPYAGAALLTGIIFSGIFYLACRGMPARKTNTNYSIRLDDSPADSLIV